jgi:hypothetical protein
VAVKAVLVVSKTSRLVVSSPHRRGKEAMLFDMFFNSTPTVMAEAFHIGNCFTYGFSPPGIAGIILYYPTHIPAHPRRSAWREFTDLMNVTPA